MLPLAHGNDGGGSIRIPAACCGLVGLKPSRGRVSRGPDLGDSWLACDGVLTRTVADTAHALDVLGGYEVGDANWAPRPAEPYAASMRRDPGPPADRGHGREPLRRRRRPRGDRRACGSAAELLAALGHDVVEAAPAWPPPDVLEIFINVFGPAIALGINSGVLRNGREPGEDEIEPLSRVLFERARATPSIGYLTAMAQLQALARGLVAFFADYDVLVTPALAERPLAIGECNGLGAEPLRGPGALGHVHALHGAVQHHRPARDLAARSASAPTGCRPACSSSASRSTRTRCSSSRCRSRRRTRGRTTAQNRPTSAAG